MITSAFGITKTPVYKKAWLRVPVDSSIVVQQRELFCEPLKIPRQMASERSTPVPNITPVKIRPEVVERLGGQMGVIAASTGKQVFGQIITRQSQVVTQLNRADGREERIMRRSWPETVMDAQLRHAHDLIAAEPCANAQLRLGRAVEREGLVIAPEPLKQFAVDDRTRASADRRVPTVRVGHGNPSHAHRRQHQLASEALKRRCHVNNGGRQDSTPREISPDWDIPMARKARIAVRDERDRVTGYLGASIAGAWYSRPGFKPSDHQARLGCAFDQLLEILASAVRRRIVDDH